MAKTLGSTEKIQEAREVASAKREQADARRAIVRANLAEKSVIPVEQAQEQIMRLATGVRKALDSVYAELPAHLTPEERQTCETAIKEAISRAMQSLDSIR